MSYLDVIRSARQAYLRKWTSEFRKLDGKYPHHARESAVSFPNNPYPSDTYIYDIGIGGDGVEERLDVAGKTVAVDCLDRSAGGKRIRLSSFCWSATSIQTAGAELPIEDILEWFERWIGRGTGSENNKEYQGVIHSLAFDDESRVRIDFGSAPMSAFTQLMDILDRSPVEEIGISAADRNDPAASAERAVVSRFDEEETGSPGAEPDGPEFLLDLEPEPAPAQGVDAKEDDEPEEPEPDVHEPENEGELAALPPELGGDGVPGDELPADFEPLTQIQIARDDYNERLKEICALSCARHDVTRPEFLLSFKRRSKLLHNIYILDHAGMANGQVKVGNVRGIAVPIDITLAANDGQTVRFGTLDWSNAEFRLSNGKMPIGELAEWLEKWTRGVSRQDEAPQSVSSLTKWFEKNEVEDERIEFRNIVHGLRLSGDRRINVDFGSAPLDALTELLVILRDTGARRVEIDAGVANRSVFDEVTRLLKKQVKRENSLLGKITRLIDAGDGSEGGGKPADAAGKRQAPKLGEAKEDKPPAEAADDRKAPTLGKPKEDRPLAKIVAKQEPPTLGERKNGDLPAEAVTERKAPKLGKAKVEEPPMEAAPEPAAPTPDDTAGGATMGDEAPPEPSTQRIAPAFGSRKIHERPKDTATKSDGPAAREATRGTDGDEPAADGPIAEEPHAEASAAPVDPPDDDAGDGAVETVDEPSVGDDEQTAAREADEPVADEWADATAATVVEEPDEPADDAADADEPVDDEWADAVAAAVVEEPDEPAADAADPDQPVNDEWADAATSTVAQEPDEPADDAADPDEPVADEWADAAAATVAQEPDEPVDDDWTDIVPAPDRQDAAAMATPAEPDTDDGMAGANAMDEEYAADLPATAARPGPVGVSGLQLLLLVDLWDRVASLQNACMERLHAADDVEPDSSIELEEMVAAAITESAAHAAPEWPGIAPGSGASVLDRIEEFGNEGLWARGAVLHGSWIDRVRAPDYLRFDSPDEFRDAVADVVTEVVARTAAEEPDFTSYSAVSVVERIEELRSEGFWARGVILNPDWFDRIRAPDEGRPAPPHSLHDGVAIDPDAATGEPLAPETRSDERQPDAPPDEDLRGALTTLRDAIATAEGQETGSDDGAAPVAAPDAPPHAVSDEAAATAAALTRIRVAVETSGESLRDDDAKAVVEDDTAAPVAPQDVVDEDAAPGESWEEARSEDAAPMPVEESVDDQPVAAEFEHDTYDEPVAAEFEPEAHDEPVAAAEEPDTYDEPVAAEFEPEAHDEPVAAEFENDTYDEPVAAEFEPEAHDEPVAAAEEPDTYDEPVAAEFEPEAHDEPVAAADDDDMAEAGDGGAHEHDLGTSLESSPGDADSEDVQIQELLSKGRWAEAARLQRGRTDRISKMDDGWHDSFDALRKAVSEITISPADEPEAGPAGQTTDEDDSTEAGENVAAGSQDDAAAAGEFVAGFDAEGAVDHAIEHGSDTPAEAAAHAGEPEETGLPGLPQDESPAEAAVVRRPHVESLGTIDEDWSGSLDDLRDTLTGGAAAPTDEPETGEPRAEEADAADFDPIPPDTGQDTGPGDEDADASAVEHGVVDPSEAEPGPGQPDDHPIQELAEGESWSEAAGVHRDKVERIDALDENWSESLDVLRDAVTEDTAPVVDEYETSEAEGDAGAADETEPARAGEDATEEAFAEDFAAPVGDEAEALPEEGDSTEAVEAEALPEEGDSTEAVEAAGAEAPAAPVDEAEAPEVVEPAEAPAASVDEAEPTAAVEPVVADDATDAAEAVDEHPSGATKDEAATADELDLDRPIGGARAPRPGRRGFGKRITKKKKPAPESGLEPGPESGLEPGLESEVESGIESEGPVSFVALAAAADAINDEERALLADGAGSAATADAGRGAEEVPDPPSAQTIEDTITEFYDWFAFNGGLLATLLDRIRSAFKEDDIPEDEMANVDVEQLEQAIDRVHSMHSEIVPILKKIDRRLVIEFTAGQLQANGLVISANWDPKCASMVRKIVEGAPALHDWDVIAFRPARVVNYVIRYGIPGEGEIEIDPMNVAVSLDAKLNKIDVTLHLEEQDEVRRAMLQEAGECMIQNMLGEYLSMEALGRVILAGPVEESSMGFAFAELERRFRHEVESVQKALGVLCSAPAKQRKASVLSDLEPSIQILKETLMDFGQVEKIELRLSFWCAEEGLEEAVRSALPDFEVGTSTEMILAGRGEMIEATGACPLDHSEFRAWLDNALTPLIEAGIIPYALDEWLEIGSGEDSMADWRIGELMDKGRWAEAARLQRHQVDRIDEHGEGWHASLAGMCYMEADHCQLAIRFFNQALPVLEDETSRLELLGYLGECYERLGRISDALPYLTSAVQGNPKEPQRQYSLGRAHALMEDSDSACLHLGEAARQDSDFLGKLLEDTDLDLIRDTGEFKALLVEFKPLIDKMAG